MLLEASSAIIQVFKQHHLGCPPERLRIHLEEPVDPIEIGWEITNQATTVPWETALIIIQMCTILQLHNATSAFNI